MISRPPIPPDFSALTPVQAASYWLVRQDADEMSGDDCRAFDEWLTASPLHRDAYDRAKAIWRIFDSPADDPNLGALRAAALSMSATSRRPTRFAAAAALVCAVSFLAIVAMYDAAPVEHYVTARDKGSTVTLSDGTVAMLNRDTAIDVAFSGNARRVVISRGEAFFEVAKNPQRPFWVDARGRRITALGTQFDVRLDPDRLEVVLLEGRVSIDRASSPMTDFPASRKTHVELRPGQRWAAASGVPMAVTNVDAQRLTSWRRGWVVFENETLAGAVAELNRYAPRPIVPDGAVAELRLSGVFRTGQPERFVAAIQELLPVRAVHDPEGRTQLLPATARSKAEGPN